MTELFSDLHFTSHVWEFLLPAILIISDILTGLIQALVNNDFQSKRMRQGLYHKALEILIIGLGFIFNIAFNAHFIHVAIVVYVCVMELGSILENLRAGGIDLGPLSKILKAVGQDKVANVIDSATEKETNKEKENEK